MSQKLTAWERAQTIGSQHHSESHATDGDDPKGGGTANSEMNEPTKVVLPVLGDLDKYKEVNCMDAGYLFHSRTVE